MDEPSAALPGRLRGPWRAALALALLLAPAAARPAEEGAIDARYSVSVAGIRIADLALSVVPGEQESRARLVMESVGLAAAWSGARSELVSLVRRNGEGPPLPVRFEAQHSKRDRERAVIIRYDGAGDIAGLEITSRSRRRESEVPPELWTGTVDPLTAFERLRDWLPAAIEGRAPTLVTVPIFDGRKRLDLEARYVGSISGALPNGAAAHELAVRLIGRFGFDEDDSFIRLPDSGQPPPLRVLVSADGAFLPLRLDMPARRSSPVIELLLDCRQLSCPAPDR